MSKSKAPMYLGLAAAGAGGYYLYKAGGDPKAATQDIKSDANRARGKIPTGQEAEKAGEQVGKEGVSNIEEAVNNARTKAKPDERIPELTQKAGGRLDEAREKVNAGVDKMDRKVEEKAAEAKGGLSGWFGGGK